jgi:hypothetical protein
MSAGDGPIQNLDLQSSFPGGEGMAGQEINHNQLSGPLTLILSPEGGKGRG